MRRLNNAGDTIVEVLIAIAIVGMVLAGAYASSSRSLQAERRSQERAEALKVAEQQLELLKVRGQQNPAVLAVGNFCLDTNGDRYDMTNGPPPTNYAVDAYTRLPSGNYPTQCPVSYNAGSYSYFPWIQRTVGTETYTVRVRWDGAGGIKQETMLSYRIHP